MTVLTGPTGTGHNADGRPVPWWRMAWVTWRRHWMALAGTAALLIAPAGYLWLTGLAAHHAYAPVAACHPSGSADCQSLLSNFSTQTYPRAETIAALLQVLPVLIGAFAGASVLAREMGTGNLQYAWSQGTGTWRWTLGKLVPLAVTVAAAAGAFGALFYWYFGPILSQGGETPFAPTVFDLCGIALAGWTLVAFAIGALAGALIRRVVPAIAATLTGYTGLALTTGTYLRQQYLTPLSARNPTLPGAAWIISQWYTTDGKPVSESVINGVLQGDPIQRVGSYGAKQTIDPVQYLTQHGYTTWMTYQPASRFWAFQWIEGGWLVALSLLLIAATVWLVRRRAV